MAVAARQTTPAGEYRPPEVVAAPTRRRTSAGLVLAGIVTVLVGAWGGIAPYVAPTFGFSADGSSAWHWTLSHALLGLVPGAAAVVTGFLLLGAAGRLALGRGRIDTGLLGLIAAVCGAWFVVGEFAWPVLFGPTYFVGAAPLHYLLEQLAFSIGTGVVLVACGAYILGWAMGHDVPRPRLVRSAEPIAEPLEPTTAS